jgi:hypothetical protein
MGFILKLTPSKTTGAYGQYGDDAVLNKIELEF